jgi:hypothetical protein
MEETSDKLILSPLSPKTFNIYDIYKNMDTDPVEGLIFSYSFIPIRKIIINDKNGKYAKYVIAMTKFGQICIIDLDISGSSIISENDTTVRRDDSFDIQHSIKIGAINTVGNEVNGILFVLRKGMIIVYVNKDLTTVQESYVYEQEIHSNFEISTNPIPYVIIKLSEIKADNAFTQRRIYLSTKKLRGNSFEDCKVFISDFLEKIEQLSKNFEEMIDCSFGKMREMIDSMSHMKKEIELVPDPVPEELREDYSNIVDTLVSQNDTFIATIETINAFKRYLQLVSQLNEDIGKSKVRIGSIDVCERGNQKLASEILKRYWEKK